MNYRHGFHAGNFADVFKHALLARLIVYLTRKDTPFRVIDTHAGEGAYDLAGDEAERTLEWRGGIGRLADLSDADEETRALLAPYLDCVGAFGPDGRPALYPGSPMIAAKLMRPQDRAIFCELRPDAFEALRYR
ncbi:MAG: 23S rRNA (adenine(2030)-N(6))-methyltransferase RlmJ, partial [Hyphomicrobiales bacterium]